jgi:hypothetical protein
MSEVVQLEFDFVDEIDRLDKIESELKEYVDTMTNIFIKFDNGIAEVFNKLNKMDLNSLMTLDNNIKSFDDIKELIKSKE